MDSTARKDANKSREKLDLNVKSVIVITLEIAKEEFIYEKGIYVKTRKGIHGIKPTTTLKI